MDSRAESLSTVFFSIVLTSIFCSFIRLQFAAVPSFVPHSLDGIHHVALLIQNGVPHLGRPLEVLIQTFERLREGDQGLYAWIPWPAWQPPWLAFHP